MIVSALGPSSFSDVLTKALPNGDQIRFDGSFYEFRAADAKKMIKLWVPPGTKPVRGVFISGHGGGGGDSREFTRDANMRSLAVRYGFALAGLHNFPGGQAYESGAKVFFDALDEFAKLGRHPEIANIPFAFFGSSNGGSQSYAFVNYAPQRAVCFVSNVCSRFKPETPVDGAIRVPGFIILGMYDPFNKEEAGVKAAAETVEKARARGARWSLIVERKGHEDGIAFDVYVKLFEQAVALRYPASADPSKGPVALREIPEENGWLVDQSTWDNGITQIADFKNYAGDKAKAGWVLNKDMAFVYRAAATHNNPLVVGIEEVSRVYNPHTNPGTMFSIGGPVVDPGKKLRIVCNTADFPAWTRIEFYNGANKLGQVSAPDNPVLSIVAEKTSPVCCLTVLAWDKAKNARTAAPFYFVVRDPALDTMGDSERARPPVWKDTVGLIGSTSAAKAPADYAVKIAEGENLLVAYGLTAEQEKSFATDPVSAFWSLIPADREGGCISLTPARNGATPFSGVTTADARVKVKAAHSARGLYLCFEVMDNHFVDPVEGFNYIECDVVDVLLDGKSSRQINDPANLAQFMNPGWALTLSTRQFQVAFGADNPPKIMKRNQAEAWEMVYHEIGFADAKKFHGIQVRHVKIDRLTRVQEWFIPWQEVGVGAFTREPDVGARIGFSIGYNDTDPGETAVKKLRWVDKASPWNFSAADGKPPRGWGDLEIGPLIGSTAQK